MDEALLEEPELLAPTEHSQDEALFGEPVAPGPRSEAPLALYRRYRPDRFADVIGQDHVTAPLQRALTNNRVNHAYLFSGPRGCGKTTSARILARALNCELGPIAEPCGHCQSCRDLARGGSGSIDVIEIDAASHGGVDDARDLRERAFFSPVSSRYKIYIVDEAHMVSSAGFNALLKLVEEPPPHVKFIFATTEPDKVIGTIRSRTHHYPFRLVPPRVLTDYLGKLCAAEGIAVEPAVLPLVVRAGAGSVRDSLSVLDQLLGGADESGVTYRHATALLGYTPDSLLDEFMDAFAAGDAGGVFACVDKVIEVGQDPRRFAEDLLRRLRDLVIVAAVPDAMTSGLVEVAGDQAERLSLQAAALGAGELTRAAEVIAVGLTEMRGTTAPRLHLELMCARVLLPGADVDDRGLHARLDRIERRLGVVDSSAPTAAPTSAPSAPTSAPLSAPSPPTPPAPRPLPQTEPAPDTGRTTGGSGSSTPPDTEPPEPPAAEQPTVTARPTSPAPRPTRPATSARPELATDLPEPSDERGPAGGESDDTALGADPEPPASTGRPSLSVTDVRRLWPEVLEEVKNKRRFTWMLLSQNAQVAELRNNTLLLSMANVGARDHFSRGGSEDVLKDAIVVVLGADFAIETIVDSGSGGGGLSARVEPDRPADPFDRPKAAPPSQPDSGTMPATSPTAASSTAGSATAASPAAGSPATASSRPEPSRPEAAPAPVDPALRSQARQGIRPTRSAGDSPNADDRDAAASRDDSDLDETSESHTELLARHLGAEIIAEEEDGA